MRKSIGALLATAAMVMRNAASLAILAPRTLGPAIPALALIELPMASRSILAGVKASVVIKVGTAMPGGIISSMNDSLDHIP